MPQLLGIKHLDSLPRRGFTLLELLIVVGIIAMLSSMIFVDGGDKKTPVQVAAMELEATCSKARNLARQTGLAHAVYFHIENYGDGRVLRNFGPEDEGTFRGRHWYAIVGPNKGAVPNTGNTGGNLRSFTKNPHMPPLVNAPNNYDDDKYDQFMHDVEISQVGPRIYLPEGVRFLALSDYDFGFNISDDRIWATNKSDSQLLDEFPKPWFGVLKPKSALPNGIRPSNGEFVLYPWGGGDLEWENARNAQNSTAFGTLSGQATNPNIHGPLIDGNRLDFCILFRADGSAFPIEAFAARRAFTRLKQNNGHIYQDQDLMHHPYYWNARRTAERNEATEVLCNSGLHHASRITGGVHITLCRDIDESEEIYPEPGRFDVFEDEADALQSILPLYRVYVNNFSAAVEVRAYGHPMAEIKLNQSRLSPAEVTQSHPTQGTLYRPAYRHSYFADDLIPALQSSAPAWDDTPEGWRGWYPGYP